MLRTSLTIVIVLTLTMGLVYASSTPYEPPEGGDEWQKSTVMLKGTAHDPDATGKAILACNMDETQHRTQLSGQKLAPGAVYSIWLVQWDSEEDRVVRQMRVDDPKKTLKADRNGKLAFTSNLPTCPQPLYNMVVVREHTDGDSESAANMVTAMKGQMPH